MQRCQTCSPSCADAPGGNESAKPTPNDKTVRQSKTRIFRMPPCTISVWSRVCIGGFTCLNAELESFFGSCRHGRRIRSRQQGAKPVRTRYRGRGGVRELSPDAIGRHHHPHRDPRALRGRGIASELVEGALRLIRADGLKVVAGCGFVVDYLRKHPEFADMAG